MREEESFPEFAWSMEVKASLAMVHSRISEAARRAGRPPESITLVAVTKTVPVEKILQVIEGGVRVLGENRVQEALPKIAALASRGVFPEWHFVGKLQRNKVKSVVGRFSMIHSVDSLVLAEAISKHAERSGIRQEILVEVNVSGEQSKEGFSPGELMASLNRITRLNYVKLKGLMTVPPLSGDPEGARPWFRKLRNLGRAVEERQGQRLEVYSMGMSSDFEVAIEEGATHVRIGRALFGERS